jgi:hypothetical protein
LLKKRGLLWIQNCNKSKFNKPASSGLGLGHIDF